MDSQDLPDNETKQASPIDSTGLARATPAKPRGRPRKQTAGSDGGTVEGFKIPSRPAVEQENPDKRTFTVIPHRAIHADISSGAFRTLAQIASYSNKNGFTWVGLQRLANEKGVTVQAISKHVQELKQNGLIEETTRAYWKGPTPRTSTMRIIFDPSMSDEDVISRAGSAEQVETISREVLVDSTSLVGEVVDQVQVSREPTKADLERLLPSLIAEVQARYRSEGLPVPVGDRLAREVADLTSAKQRSGTLL